MADQVSPEPATKGFGSPRPSKAAISAGLLGAGLVLQLASGWASAPGDLSWIGACVLAAFAAASTAQPTRTRIAMAIHIVGAALFAFAAGVMAYWFVVDEFVINFPPRPRVEVIPPGLVVREGPWILVLVVPAIALFALWLSIAFAAGLSAHSRHRPLDGVGRSTVAIAVVVLFALVAKGQWPPFMDTGVGNLPAGWVREMSDRAALPAPPFARPSVSKEHAEAIALHEAQSAPYSIAAARLRASSLIVMQYLGPGPTNGHRSTEWVVDVTPDRPFIPPISCGMPCDAGHLDTRLWVEVNATNGASNVWDS